MPLGPERAFDAVRSSIIIAQRNSLGAALLVALIALVVCVLLLVASFRANVDILQQRFPSVVQEQANLRSTTLAAVSAQAQMDALLATEQADRVLLIRIINGSFDIGRLPVAMAHIVQSAVARGVEFSDRHYVPTPAVMYRAALSSEVCTSLSVDSVEDNSLRARLRDRGVQHAVWCPLRFEGNVLGLVAVEWTDATRVPRDAIAEAQSATARISLMLGATSQTRRP